MSDEEDPVSPVGPVQLTPVRMTKAEKLEAKAARLREADAAGASGGLTPRLQLYVGVPLGAIIVVLLVLAFLQKAQVDDRNSQLHKLKKDLAGVPVLRSQAAELAKSIAQLEQLEALRSSAARTATDVSASFGTYDYKTLVADFARTRAYLTPSFASDFTKLTASLGSLITQDKGQTVGTVEGVGVTSITTKTAVVIVFLDQKVTTAQSSTPRLDHNRLRLTLARQADGTWLVSKLELI